MPLFLADGSLLSSKREVPEVSLFYPGLPGSAKELEISLSHVRAADSIRVGYDLARDGWIIKQASVFEWDGDDKVCDPDWREIIFIKAWGREVNSTNESLNLTNQEGKQND